MGGGGGWVWVEIWGEVRVGGERGESEKREYIYINKNKIIYKII